MNSDNNRRLRILKKAYRTRGCPEGGTHFETRVMAAVRDRRDEEPYFGRLYLRFAAAAICLSLLVHVSSQYGAPDDSLSLYGISSRVDPVDILEALDD